MDSTNYLIDLICDSAPTIQANDVFSIPICMTYFGALQVQYTYIHTYIHTSNKLQSKFCYLSSLSIFYVGRKTISRRVARRLKVLHPNQNIESELK